MKMSMLKRVLGLVLALVMAFSIVACAPVDDNKDTNPGDTTGGTEGKEPVTLIMYTYASTTQPGLQEMIQEVQRYVKEKLNVDLDLRLQSQKEFQSTMSTRIDAGEEWDICLVGNGVDFQTYANRNAFAPITDYVDLLPKTTGQLIDNALDSFTIDDEVYAVPVLKDMFDRNGFTINQSLLDDLGVKFPADYATRWDTVDFLYDLKEARDAKYPDEVDNPIIKDAMYNYDQWFLSERLVGGWNKPIVDVNISEDYGYKGISLNDTAFCPVYTQEFRDLMKLVYKMVDDGIGAFDPPNFDTDNVLLNAGKLVGSCDSGLISVAEDANPNYKSAFYPSSICFAADYTFGFSVNAKCKNVDRAVELLELMQTDTYLATTLHFGKEGSGWTDTNNDNVIELTDKNSDPSARYWYNWYGWPLGGVTAMKAIPGSSPDMMDQMRELNKTAQAKPNRGFKFDQTPVENELAAVNNVYAEHYGVLCSGQNANVDELVDNFIAELKANGMDKIIAEAQSQLDAWRAANIK